MLALDGPAASGKSTVGLSAAERLGFFYFDTGVLYRALTWIVLQHGLDVNGGGAVAELARSVCFEVRRPSVADGRQADVLADGQDVTWDIRRPEVDANVSVVSAYPAVRDAMRGPQRDAILAPGTILAGRDIGTVIAPDANLKVWLHASAEERARRRSEQTGEPYEQVLAKMIARDRIDSSRAVAPARPAADAVLVETDGVPAEQVVNRIVGLAEERGARAHGRQRAGS